jgi:hypothetical protein
MFASTTTRAEASIYHLHVDVTALVSKEPRETREAREPKKGFLVLGDFKKRG